MRPVRGLALVLGGLALLSLSSRVYAGPVKLLDLGAKLREDIFGSAAPSAARHRPVAEGADAPPYEGRTATGQSFGRLV